ncbi:MAG TPA: chorismate synthase [Clostridiales bacterium]|nr:chorismate synthase [Clostridiales bacterium]
MSSITGNKLKVSIFGESHGEGIGVVVDGLPPGIELDLDYIDFQMKRRAPGQNDISTPRKESDRYKILSGFFENKTTGAPLCAIIFNEDKNSKDYSEIKNKIRPGHSDYTGYIKYRGYNDYRGGGHFSGRLTAPLLFAGSIAMQLLERKKIFIGSRIKSIYNIEDDTAPKVDETEINTFKQMTFPVICEKKRKQMEDEIVNARNSNDSLGGIVETYIINVPAGYGQPFFDSVESRISHMIFSIPAVKGIEFGAGFKITVQTGKEANDEFYVANKKIMTKTNNSGGILGGISNGMPIIFRTAIKPTASISSPQSTVDISKMETTVLNIAGRHDPCIVPRVLPVIDGAAALVILDLMLERDGEIWI